MGSNGGGDLLTVGLVVLAVLFGAPLVVLAVVAPLTALWLFGGGHVGAVGGPELLVLLALFLPLALLVLAALYILRASERRESTDPALEELRRAYARGDLTDEEFQRRRERLERD